MNIDDENEIKKEFQLERLIFFSDAVFAIIITIMILDVKLPEQLVHPTEQQSKNALLQILPKVFAYGVSFFVIGSFWMRHLKVFSFLKNYNKQLIMLNLFFLFSVSLFPFALSFAFSSSNMIQYTWGMYTYISIIYFAFLTQSFLIGYLIRNKEELCLKSYDIETILKWKIIKIRFFSFPVFFILMVCTLYFHISIYIVFGTMMVYGIVMVRLKKKWYPDSKEDDVTFLSFFRRPQIARHQVKRVHK